MKRKMYNNRMTRGYSVFEHDIYLKYDIRKDNTHPYFNTLEGTSMEGGTVEFETDGDGFLVPSRIYQDADINIFFLGDSTMECALVEPEERIPYAVGRRLEKLISKKINSFNAAVSSADILSMSKVLLSKVFLESPDVVILSDIQAELEFLLSKENCMCGKNNNKPRVIYPDLARWGNGRDKVKEIMKIICPTIHRKIYLKNRQEPESDTEIYTEQTTEQVECALELFKQDLACFWYLCKSRGVECVLMTVVNNYMKNDRAEQLYNENLRKRLNVNYRTFSNLFVECNNYIRIFSKKNNVCLIDLDTLLDSDSCLYDNVHYNRGGQTLVLKC